MLRVSRGIGNVGRLVLAAIQLADEQATPHLTFERAGWWKVHRISLIASQLADEQTARRFDVDVERWRALWAQVPKKIPQRRPCFGDYITISRTLASLQRRGLVERNIWGPGSLVRLTDAGRRAIAELSVIAVPARRRATA